MLNDTSVTGSSPAQEIVGNSKVFLVHGDDDELNKAVKRFLEQIGFVPILLFGQTNRTILEAIQAHRDVGFAVVVLAPGSAGHTRTEDCSSRAPQNVLLELGYFVGALGKRNVCVIQKGDMEVPPGWRFLINAVSDKKDAWKQMLVRDLQSAGYEPDWTMVMLAWSE